MLTDDKDFGLDFPTNCCLLFRMQMNSFHLASRFFSRTGKVNVIFLFVLEETNPVNMPNRFRLTVLLCAVLCPHLLHGQLTAILKYEYYSPATHYFNITQETHINGFVSSRGSHSTVFNGSVFTMMDVTGRYDACQPPWNSKIYSNGIAVIQRGGDCTFSVKITRAKQYGAAGRRLLPSREICRVYFLFSFVRFSRAYLRSAK